MARLSSALMLLGFLGAGLVTASPKPFEDQETQMRNAACDNKCLFEAWSEGFCVDDPACMCKEKERREKYFCCMAEKCDPAVFPAALKRAGTACEERGLPFTIDAEADCGIKLQPVSSSSTLPPAASTSSSSGSGSVSTTTTAGGSQTSSGGASQTSSPGGSGASGRGVVLSGVAGLVAASGLFLLL